MRTTDKLNRADYLEWNNAIALIHQLEKDKDFRMSSFIACGVFLGLRVSDLLKLKYVDVLQNDSIQIIEQKTGKTRTLAINSMLKDILETAYKKQNIENLNQHIFTNRNGDVLTMQYLNRRLKEIKIDYRVKIGKFSCHSLRKAFGRRVYEMNNCSEKALILLGEVFNHSSLAITKIYLGIRQCEIQNVYLSL